MIVGKSPEMMAKRTRRIKIMRCTAPLPGEKLLVLIIQLKAIINERKNERMIKPLTQALCSYLLGVRLIK